MFIIFLRIIYPIKTPIIPDIWNTKYLKSCRAYQIGKLIICVKQNKSQIPLIKFWISVPRPSLQYFLLACLQYILMCYKIYQISDINLHLELCDVFIVVNMSREIGTHDPNFVLLRNSLCSKLGFAFANLWIGLEISFNCIWLCTLGALQL